MKTLILNLLTFALVFLTGATALLAQDMRALKIQARQSREALMEKAAAEKAKADQAALESLERITRNRESLKKAISGLETINLKLENDIQILSEEFDELDKKERQLNQELAETGAMIKELVGAIRINARDVDALISQNHQTNPGMKNPSFLESVARDEVFPGMDEIRGISRALIRQIDVSGQVVFQKGSIINRSGRKIETDMLLIGPFTAAYRTENESGFCHYTSGGLYALSRLPSRRMQKDIIQYMEGRSEAVPMDISRGGALNQLTHELSLWDQIPKGGPIVWPILIILVLGSAIVLERIIFLVRRKAGADVLIDTVESLSIKNNWKDCEKTCEQHIQKPLARVVKAGLICRHMRREEIENALQEAILKEIPPMDRFLSTLGMLAAIAPLLGLLGTVTGMINTFHVITMHGTGDPRLMSGGISEALVTTMLGLSVAIPLLLSQTLLNRSVEKRIDEMEEKAVTLVNIIHKNKRKT